MAHIDICNTASTPGIAPNLPGLLCGQVHGMVSLHRDSFGCPWQLCSNLTTAKFWGASPVRAVHANRSYQKQKRSIESQKWSNTAHTNSCYMTHRVLTEQINFCINRMPLAARYSFSKASKCFCIKISSFRCNRFSRFLNLFKRMKKENLTLADLLRRF